MTREEFKKRWESNEQGGGITYSELVDCYVEWGLGTMTKEQVMKNSIYMHRVLHIVLKEVGLE